jgi:hypothetical protein
MKKVIRLTESELTDLIHRIIVETEMDGEMEEGFFGASKKEKEEAKRALINKMEDLLGNSEYTEDDLANSMESILSKAKDSSYKGKVIITHTSKGKPMFGFKPELTNIQKIATGTGALTYGR